jgi:hypothetical protein
MALIRGALISYADPLAGGLPAVIAFQYNPVQVTRVLTAAVEGEVSGRTEGSANRAAPRPSAEDYAFTLELDATDGLEIGGPLTTALGIAPRIAALELLMQPLASSPLMGLLGGLLGGGTAVPATKLPLVLFAWSASRVTPVRVRSLTVRETAFDALLNPVHATVDVGLSVLRRSDLPREEAFARAAADYYQNARAVMAASQAPQAVELGG